MAESNISQGISGDKSDNESNIDTRESDKFPLSLMVNEEQQKVIFDLFLENDWEYQEIDTPQDVPMEVDDENRSSYRIPQDNECDECIYCLCKPCITSERNRQMWWESQNHPARRNNNLLRKDKYKKFWTMLFHRGVFLDERYISLKQEALRRDPNQRNMIWHRRDILPKCVLEIVRGWFPNPKGVAYMGHMWE